MGAKTGFVCLILLGTFASVAVAQDAPQTDKVHWCPTIPISDVWRESQFTAVFVFDVDASGKPVHIKGVRVPLTKDDGPLIECISSWSLPSISGKVTAAFHWKWHCLDIGISTKENHRTFPCQEPKPTT
jgi:hypothetical protein